MPSEFQLHERMAADTFHIVDWPLCAVLLMNERDFPWLVLVPKRSGLRDLHNLSAEDTPVAMAEIARASRMLEQLLAPDKMNVAALGNQVPQLHIHVIARFESDAAWPKPVWGVTPHAPYGEAELKERLDAFRAAASG